ncbi:MAG: DUF167 family protein [Hyphomicrobiaceae bacterium]
MTRSDHAFSTTSDGITIRFRLTPRSARDRVDGVVETPAGPAVQARVRALPENGAANTALISLSAKWLGVPKSSIALSAGAKARVKVLEITGDSSELTRLVSEKIGSIQL